MQVQRKTKPRGLVVDVRPSEEYPFLFNLVHLKLSDKGALVLRRLKVSAVCITCDGGGRLAFSGSKKNSKCSNVVVSNDQHA